MTTRGDPLRALLVEDSEADAQLLELELRRQGFAPRMARVETEAALRGALDRQWDVVLADYALPGFGAFRTLAVVRDHDPDLPVIVVSGSVGDEELVAAMRAGASDYVLKDNLSRLAPAIRRELRDAVASRQRREADRARREAEQRFRFVVEHTGDVPYRLRFDTMTYDYIGPAIERLTGYTPQEINAVPFATWVEAATAPLVGSAPRPTLQASPEAERPDESWTDLHVRTKSGERRWLANHSFTWKDDEGRALGSVGVFSDITERKRAEEALRKSEERYRQIVETAREGIWVIDAEGRTTYGNGRMAEMLGTTLDELLLGSMYDFMDQEARQEAERNLDRRRRGVEEQHEFRFLRKDGTALWALLSTNPILDADGSFVGALAMVTDLTERRELEAQLLQSQKLEAVGRLAAGVAHDFNNLLSVITGYAQLLAGGLGGKDRARVDEILKAGARAASLTRQLLSFGRRQLFEPRVIDLNTIVADMDKMLRRVIGEDIELVTCLDPDLGRVRADPGQIEQVLMNLVVNARDAMPRGGKLTIETGNADFDEEYARRHLGVASGPYATLAVSDTGVGMDEETRGHVFEPFFTTKEPGRGTGLGLATVYGIVKQSGGHISVLSEPNRGAIFRTYLPRVDGPAEGPAAAPAGGGAPGGTETVLLVEDEEQLRDVIREILESLGYRVLEAPHPQEALRVAAAHEGRIHLLLTDVVMPGTSGRALAESLVAARPYLKVVFMSGYTDPASGLQGGLPTGTHFLQKPFNADALARKIRMALDGPTVTDA